MKTPRGDQINIKVEQLKDKFKNYLTPIFEEWKRVVPTQIQEKLMQPLFTINDNKTIGLNFSEEVIVYNQYLSFTNYFYYFYLQQKVGCRN